MPVEEGEQAMFRSRLLSIVLPVALFLAFGFDSQGEPIPNVEIFERYVEGEVYSGEDITFCTDPKWAEAVASIEKLERDEALDVVNFLARRIVCVEAGQASFKYLGTLTKNGALWVFRTREEHRDVWWMAGKIELREGVVKTPGSPFNVISTHFDPPIPVYIVWRVDVQKS